MSSNRKDLQVIIPAAGRGSRSGLSYPKCLFPIDGKPIIQRLINTLVEFDSAPLVITSPDGNKRVVDALKHMAGSPFTSVQHMPRGMGDAILTGLNALDSSTGCRHALVVWSDILFLNENTVRTMVQAHLQSDSALTFVTALTDSAYTRVERNADGDVVSVTETREAGLDVAAGERDIGLFIFQIKPVMRLLAQELDGKYGKTTGEHGFLYVIRHLVDHGYRVEGLPIATPPELVSFNSLSDIDEYVQS